MKQLYNYKVLSVDKIVDGDTIDLTIDLGFKLTKSDRYRMAGYDACETFRPHNDLELQAGLKTKDYFASQITLYKDALIVSTYKDTDIYGRYSGTITSPSVSGEVNINNNVLDFMVTNHLTKGDILK